MDIPLGGSACVKYVGALCDAPARFGGLIWRPPVNVRAVFSEKLSIHSLNGDAPLAATNYGTYPF